MNMPAWLLGEPVAVGGKICFYICDSSGHSLFSRGKYTSAAEIYLIGLYKRTLYAALPVTSLRTASGHS